MMRFACPHCKATVSAPEEKIGVRVYCPRCRQAFQVPGAASGAAPSLRTSGTASKPSVVAIPPSLPPTPQEITQRPAASAASPSTPSLERPRSLLTFVAGLVIGLVIGALLGGGIVWMVLARQGGH